MEARHAAERALEAARAAEAGALEAHASVRLAYTLLHQGGDR